MNKGITVIICTRNGSSRLKPTLEHVAQQQGIKGISWELILADNGSTDDSILLTSTMWTEIGPAKVPLKVVEENEAGKIHALQRAIKTAKYEYLIICDDDNWLSANYLELAYKTLEDMPEVAALGGQGIPVTTGVRLPEWFTMYHSAYAVGGQASQTGFLRNRDLLWGAGLVTRRSLYLKMYEKFPSFLLEHEKKSVLSAEDTEYCMRLILKGHKLYYNALLVYQHFIPDHKLTADYRDQTLVSGFNEANKILKFYYAAMRAKIKTRSRPDIWLALLFISPINYAFARSAIQKERARNTLFFLLPLGNPPNPIAARIKSFIKN
jgi:glycosyltransferase involved in cell wall biosynthesis